MSPPCCCNKKQNTCLASSWLYFPFHWFREDIPRKKFSRKRWQIWGVRASNHAWRLSNNHWRLSINVILNTEPKSQIITFENLWIEPWIKISLGKCKFMSLLMCSYRNVGRENGDGSFTFCYKWPGYTQFVQLVYNNILLLSSSIFCYI